MEYIDILTRILSALLLGFIIGLEREMTNKYAGLRTNILVCLGACIFTIISIYGFPTFADGDNVIVSQATGVRDTARIAAQVVTGIGFIGGGTVLRHGANVFGLTTAATLWCTAAIGVLCASGFILEAISGTVIILFSNVFLRYVNKIVNQKSKYEQTKEEFKVTITSSKDRIKELIKDITSNTKFNINKLDVKKNTIILNITFFKPEEKQITKFIDIINKKYEIEEYSYEKLKEEIKIEEYDEL